MTRSLALAALLPGCVIATHDPDPAGCDGPMTVDTGASVDYVVGVDAGYYLGYLGAGRWHFEWTCDTELSALGCNFSGAISAPSIRDATCLRCEDNDRLDASPDRLTFDTATSTGFDGVEFTADGPLTVDLLVDGEARPDLVVAPSRGAARVPGCMPLALAPSVP